MGDTWLQLTGTAESRLADQAASSFLGIYRNQVLREWAGYGSRYSDWLRARRSGDRILVGGEIFQRAESCLVGQAASSFLGIYRNQVLREWAG